MNFALREVFKGRQKRGHLKQGDQRKVNRIIKLLGWCYFSKTNLVKPPEAFLDNILDNMLVNTVSVKGLEEAIKINLSLHSTRDSVQKRDEILAL